MVRTDTGVISHRLTSRYASSIDRIGASVRGSARLTRLVRRPSSPSRRAVQVPVRHIGRGRPQPPATGRARRARRPGVVEFRYGRRYGDALVVVGEGCLEVAEAPDEGGTVGPVFKVVRVPLEQSAVL